MDSIIDFFKSVDPDYLKAGAGLILLIIVNIVLGGLEAKIQDDYDWKKMWQGILKGFLVAVCISVVYYVGLLNSEIIVVNIGGVEMNLAVGVTTLVMTAFVWYGSQVIVKIAEVLNIKEKVDIKTDNDENVVPEIEEDILPEEEQIVPNENEDENANNVLEGETSNNDSQTEQEAQG